MEIVTLGIDLAKNIFALHGVGADGKVVLQRTALINRVRGLLSELGIVLPQKADTIRRELAQLLEDLPGHCNTVVADAITDLERLDARVGEYDRHIATCAKTNADARRLMQLSGIGPPTASALVASIGDGHDFASGRQFAAWLGMVPGQYSSGGKQRLGRITKAGDRYLRTLLILGARSVLQSGKKKDAAISRWTRDVEGRRGYWKAVVAKNARLAWAVLRRGEDFTLYGQEAPAGA
jgi:transposase